MCGTRPDRLIASFFSRTVFNSRERLDARDIRGQRGKDTANSVPRCDVIGFTENNEPGLVCRCTPNVDGPKFRAPLSAASLASHVKCTSTQLQGLAVRHPLPAWCYRANANFSARNYVALPTETRPIPPTVFDETPVPPSGSVRKFDSVSTRESLVSQFGKNQSERSSGIRVISPSPSLAGTPRDAETCRWQFQKVECLSVPSGREFVAQS